MTFRDKDDKKKKPQIEIREMEVDDIPAVFHLGEKLFTSEEVPNLYRTWDEFEVTGNFQEEPELCLVAEDEDRIVGFALGSTIEKSRSAWKYGYLNWLGVDPQYQRYGIATKLFNAFRDLVLGLGVRMLLVDTEADNENAIKFFRSHGFGSPEKHVYLTMNLDSVVR